MTTNRIPFCLILSAIRGLVGQFTEPCGTNLCSATGYCQFFSNRGFSVFCDSTPNTCVVFSGGTLYPCSRTCNNGNFWNPVSKLCDASGLIQGQYSYAPTLFVSGLGSPANLGIYYPCPAGSSCTGGNQPTACTVGKYQPNTGASTCLTCPSYCTLTAICPAGFQCPSGSAIRCGTGTYQSNMGASTCLSCPPASICTNTGYTTCQAGTWYTGSACAACPAGTASTAVSATSSATCAQCASGTYTPTPGYASCAACPAGSFTTGTGSTACVSCALGSDYSAAAAGCAPCATGTSRGVSTDSVCKACALGTYAPREGTRVRDWPSLRVYNATYGVPAPSVSICPARGVMIASLSDAFSSRCRMSPQPFPSFCSANLDSKRFFLAHRSRNALWQSRGARPTYSHYSAGKGVLAGYNPQPTCATSVTRAETPWRAPRAPPAHTCYTVPAVLPRPSRPDTSTKGVGYGPPVS